MTEFLVSLGVAMLGSFLNFISTKIYNTVTGQNRNFFWKKKFNSLANYRSNISFDELKKRLRILVVDDEDGFPVQLFLNENYSVEKWNKVIDFGKLENGVYDIIVLDIKGVADHISSDDGLGVLEVIKKKNPNQIIIAFSQHSYDLSKARFWALADEQIAKPSDFLRIKEKIDKLILELYRPQRYVESLHRILTSANLNIKQINRIDTRIITAIKQKKNPDWENIFDFSRNNNELYLQLITVGTTIMKFFI
jgi:hypothetical protein